MAVEVVDEATRVVVATKDRVVVTVGLLVAVTVMVVLGVGMSRQEHAVEMAGLARAARTSGVGTAATCLVADARIDADLFAGVNPAASTLEGLHVVMVVVLRMSEYLCPLSLLLADLLSNLHCRGEGRDGRSDGVGGVSRAGCRRHGGQGGGGGGGNGRCLNAQVG